MSVSHLPSDSFLLYCSICRVMLALKVVAGGNSFSGEKISSLAFSHLKRPDMPGSNSTKAVVSHRLKTESGAKFLSNVKLRLPSDGTSSLAVDDIRLTLFLLLQADRKSIKHTARQVFAVRIVG